MLSDITNEFVVFGRTAPQTSRCLFLFDVHVSHGWMLWWLFVVLPKRMMFVVGICETICVRARLYCFCGMVSVWLVWDCVS